ncbi:MAG: hypothetical protein OXI34_15825 [Chloroflexota bacterium]|nr:hypothetical protein [Chloroflexota bacterium]MDE2947150.1 hypothetical protein [Chloroflexota bacterium]
MNTPLKKEYEHYLKIREDLAKNNDGKFVAIKGDDVLGVFDDYLQAANTVYVAHEKGTVLMQAISKDPDSLNVIISTPGIASFE